ELMSTSEIILFASGFILGMILLVAISFLYFFRADKSISRILAPVMADPKLFREKFKPSEKKIYQSRLIKVEWYFNAKFGLKKTRDVTHYSHEFFETVFSRHHFAAVISIFISFLFLILIGFWLDSAYFQLPAAASITLFFAILIAISGAFSYFLQNWSIPFLVILIFGLNILYRYNILDPGNKAYGLNYKNERPEYSREKLLDLCKNENVQRDKKNMISILNKWKRKQHSAKPYLYIVSVSGGGNRSANFTMNVLQRLDSLSNGELMDKTFMITGASGGMLGASYYRELVNQQDKGVNPDDKKYVDDISQDLLNAIFTSFVARDLAAPSQRFRVGQYDYIKDRGYAFEQKLDRNTRGLMNRQLKDIGDDEKNARSPLMLFNSVVTRDGRKMIISTQPVSFLMKPVNDTSLMAPIDPDAIDFQALFKNQDPMNMRLLTALRMNATFPYVLPNVWLPSNPVIDVMDAGLRDNYGPETAVRFIQVFRDWIEENTAGVVMVQIRDRITGGWDHPYESTDITELFTKPMLILQFNWYKMQDYNQNDLLSLTQSALGKQFHRISFQYVPKKDDAGAALNFHLTKREKINIYEALDNENNKACFKEYMKLSDAAPATTSKASIAVKR
nr:patatin-like phospholipase family protein [Chitinophagaceae bacterium]